jgi:hypothetical protein
MKRISYIFLYSICIYSIFLFQHSLRCCTATEISNTMGSGAPSDQVHPLSLHPPTPAIIDGPERVAPGSLVVLTLRGASTAEWAVIPSVPFHVDRDGRTLVFASSRGQTYYIAAAAIVSARFDMKSSHAETSSEKSDIKWTSSTYFTPPTQPAPHLPGPSPDIPSDPGRPHIFVHRCVCVDDDPSPSPKPFPFPDPSPGSLRKWVSQNLPAECAPEAEAMATVYESVATTLNDGTIRTRDAAFTAIRSRTLKAVSAAAWQSFLVALSSRLHAERDADASVAALANHLRFIADGFRDVAIKVNINPSTYTIPYSIYGKCPTALCPLSLP